MTWTEYQQWAAETQAAIAVAARSVMPRAGHGVSLHDGQVTMHSRAEVPDQAASRKFSILHIFSTVGDRILIAQVAPGTGQILGDSAFQLYPPGFLDGGGGSQQAVTFRAGQADGRYLFPVQITLGQYRQLAQDDDYREDLLKSYTIDLRRNSETRNFAHTRSNESPEVVRLIKVNRI